MALDSAGNAPAESVARAAPPSARFLRDLSRSTDRVTDHLKKHLEIAKRENMETMEEDEPVSSSEAPRAPALDREEGLCLISVSRSAKKSCQSKKQDALSPLNQFVHF